MSVSTVIMLPDGYLHVEDTLQQKCMVAVPWDACILDKMRVSESGEWRD